MNANPPSPVPGSLASPSSRVNARGWNAKRALFIVILLAMVTGSVWWTVYFPFDARRLYRAVPANAVFVSQHWNVGQRWDELLQSPIVVGALRGSGMTPDEITAFADNEQARRWARQLLSRCVVTAYVPKVGANGEPAWLFASWVGAYGQVLKWAAPCAIRFSAAKDIRSLGSHGRAWVLDTGKGDPVSFAVVQGVLLVYVSANPDGILHLAERIDLGAPLSAEFREAGIEPNHSGPPGRSLPSDRGFGKWVNLTTARAPELHTYRFEISSFSGSVLTGRGSVRLKLSDSDRTAGVGDLQGFQGIVGDRADGLAGMPFCHLDALVREMGVTREFAPTWNYVKRNVGEGAPVFAAVLGREYRGRMLVSIPTLLVAIKPEKATSVGTFVPGLLDRLNMTYSLGLVPRTFQLGSSEAVSAGIMQAGDPARGTLTVVDCGKTGLFSMLSIRDRPAVAERDGWILISSNLGALVKLLGERSRSSGPCRWGAAVPPGVGGFMWVDFESIEQELRHALAAWAILLAMDSSESAVQTRQTIDQIRVWITALKDYNRGILHWTSRGVETDAELRLGSAPAGS